MSFFSFLSLFPEILPSPSCSYVYHHHHHDHHHVYPSTSSSPSTQPPPPPSSFHQPSSTPSFAQSFSILPTLSSYSTNLNKLFPGYSGVNPSPQDNSPVSYRIAVFGKRNHIPFRNHFPFPHIREIYRNHFQHREQTLRSRRLRQQSALPAKLNRRW